METRNLASSPVADVLARPAFDGAERLSAWDDYPIHQSPVVESAVSPNLPGWAERFYFNVLRPTGEIVAILGGGVYPVRGVGECYFCRLDGDRQENIRAWSELPRAGAEATTGPFQIRCESPLRDWSVGIDVDDVRFKARFVGILPPYLYSVLDVPSTDAGGDFDLYRHFVAIGDWEVEDAGGLDLPANLIGVRDRTWGVRTRRIRKHNWYVFNLGDVLLTLIHQELADGSVFFSEAGAVHGDGRVERMRVVGHDLRYDPNSREVHAGSFTLAGEDGEVRLEYERVGKGIRLAGAGYDDKQGAREDPSGYERDAYDLGDPEVDKQTGRGTIDQGARVQVTGAWSGEGTGVVETAIGRDHHRYGSQIA